MDASAYIELWLDVDTRYTHETIAECNSSFLSALQTSRVHPRVHHNRLVPSRCLSVFGGERRLGIRLRRARGLMGREEGKILLSP